MKDEPPSKPLHGIRERIDAVDDALLELLARRMSLVDEVSTVKQAAAGARVLDPAREREIARRWAETAERHGLSGVFADRVLRELLSHSRQTQETRRGPGYRDWMRRVGYQGVPGAYSDMAAAHLLDGGAAAPERVGHADFGALFDALDAGALDGALVPVENAISGSISEVVSLLTEHDVVILDEVLWTVEHCLAGVAGARLEDVERVLSHPVALQQCRRRLAARGLLPEACADTAGAAERVAREGDRSRAAICSEVAAAAHGLEILSRSVADYEHNATRFLLVARGDDMRAARDRNADAAAMKTTIVFTLGHRSGTLAGALAVLARHDINLTRIESRLRPTRRREYAFFVDFEGDRHAAKARAALEELEALAGSLRVLGSYPDRMTAARGT